MPVSLRDLQRRLRKAGRELHASVYVSASDGRSIVTACGRGAGAIYEQESSHLLPGNCSHEEVGAAVLQALVEFTTEDRYLGNLKSTDWPSFRTSGLKTVRSFEESFFRVAARCLENAIVVLEAYPLNFQQEVSVCGSIAGGDPAEVGRKLRLLVSCCIALDRAREGGEVRSSAT